MKNKESSERRAGSQAHAQAPAHASVIHQKKPGNSSNLHSGTRPPFSLSKSEPKVRVPTTTNQPRNWRRAHSACLTQFSADRIKETDPYRIKLLWQEVMESKTPSYASKNRSEAHLKESNPGEAPAGSFTAPTSYLTNSQKKSSVKNATVRDADFEETQLIPRGIEIHTDWDLDLGALAGAHGYFGSKAPSNPAETREFYRSIVEKSLRVEREIDDSIFLSIDADFVKSVHTAYRILADARAPEPEFKIYAFQNLFIEQYVRLANDPRRQLCVVRSVESSLKPESRLWRAPPLIPPNRPTLKPFGFDIYPDCQFWLSDKILNPYYRGDIGQVVHRNNFGGFCPYFSIAFKATPDDTRTVNNQVAVAGSISLFNRYQLKIRADAHPTSEHRKLVRHYGLTMEKEDWKVWLFEPKIVDYAWAGCNVRALDGGTCQTEQGICRLLTWINEIHRWGLCEYALQCEEDIKHIVSLVSKVRVSDIGAAK